jgi:L-ascorbate metabolism protein UlaG (beta-lactamase superfamily)
MVIFFLLAIIVLSVGIFFNHPKFGSTPTGERLAKIHRSPHYKNGAFQNLSATPDLSEGATFFSVMKEFFFSEKKRNKPSVALPSIKTDLLSLSKNEDVLVWFGHSSYFIQLDGKRMLVDPVLSGAASPISFTTRAFDGSDIYKPSDLPEIDYLFISHDHWDHLDYKTILALKPKIKKIICSLGTGEHLEHWGFSTDIIVERDWYENVILEEGFNVTTAPGRHFSGRGFKRNQALWTAFALQTPTMKIFMGGDSGYDTHFAEIGTKLGPFDLAILENGQYNKSWKYIHMMPNEVLKAAQELGAKRLFPVHSAKFALSLHAWDAPLKTITELNEPIGMPLITPKIGERVNLKDLSQKFAKWWEGVD